MNDNQVDGDASSSYLSQSVEDEAGEEESSLDPNLDIQAEEEAQKTSSADVEMQPSASDDIQSLSSEDDNHESSEESEHQGGQIRVRLALGHNPAASLINAASEDSEEEAL